MPGGHSILHLRQSDFRGGEQELRTIVEQDPEDTDAREGLGLALLRQGTKADAAKEFQLVLQGHPENREAKPYFRQCQ